MVEFLEDDEVGIASEKPILRQFDPEGTSIGLIKLIFLRKINFFYKDTQV